MSLISSVFLILARDSSSRPVPQQGFLIDRSGGGEVSSIDGISIAQPPIYPARMLLQSVTSKKSKLSIFWRWQLMGLDSVKLFY
jgi:hypothetical protein